MMVTPINSDVRLLRPYVSVKRYEGKIDPAFVQSSTNRDIDILIRKGAVIGSISFFTGQSEGEYDMLVFILYQSELPAI